MVEKRASVAEQLIDKLLLHIEDNHLGPGDRMPSEKEVCETYHVGRSSVREAYKAMQSRGLVVSAQGKGVFVGNKIDLGVLESTPFGNVKMQVQDYMDVRVAIEIASVRLAIQRATPEQIQSLQEIQEGFRQSIAIENTWLMAEKDEQFHTKIAEITGNPLLIQVQQEINYCVEQMCQVGIFSAVKYVLTQRGIPCGPCRKPFHSLAKEEQRKMDELIRQYDAYLTHI